MDIDEAVFLAVKVYGALNEQFEIIDGQTNPALALDMSTVRLSSCDRRVHFNVICPQEFGLFAAVISEAHISCFAEHFENGDIWVVASLSYRHPGGGQNGSEIGQFWLDATDDRIKAIVRPGNKATIFDRNEMGKLKEVVENGIRQ